MLNEFAGILIAVALVLDGVMHAYWATGRIWPAPDKLALVRAVLNIDRTRSFRPTILIPLAGMLFCGALLVLARVHSLGMLGRLVPEAWLQTGVLVVATGLLLRGLAGIVWILGLAASKSQLFYRLNLLLYTPACFVLSLAAVLVARS